MKHFQLLTEESDSFGFLFEEKPRRPFLPEKAEELKIPPGPWRRDLVNGLVATLPDGRKINPDEMLGPERPGTRLVYIGDVGRTETLVKHCRNADLLVMEATYLEEEAEKAAEFSHMTAQKTAELALLSGVQNLVLTHISRRYRERDVLAEARAIFPETIVARDFDAFQVRRGEFTRILLKDD